MPDSDASVDCDGTCSSLDSLVNLISHRQVERDLDRALSRYSGLTINDLFVGNLQCDVIKMQMRSTLGYFSPSSLRMKYRLALAYVEDNFPRSFEILLSLGVKRPYNSPYHACHF